MAQRQGEWKKSASTGGGFLSGASKDEPLLPQLQAEAEAGNRKNSLGPWCSRALVFFMRHSSE